MFMRLGVCVSFWLPRVRPWGKDARPGRRAQGEVPRKEVPKRTQPRRDVPCGWWWGQEAEARDEPRVDVLGGRSAQGRTAWGTRLGGDMPGVDVQGGLAWGNMPRGK